MHHPSNPLSAHLTAAPAAPLFAGIHLSGPNANKTSLAVLTGLPGLSPLDAPLKIGKVYEKIGSFGTLFSDERLVDMLTRGGPFAQVFVDCPLTLPPCVACQRPVCPGAMQCDDVSVAYMLSINDRMRRKGARKARPVNPQSQRLWDVLQLETKAEERAEPSYSSNLAPLVARARTLQRRLNALDAKLVLKETSVANTLEALRASLRLPARIKTLYRSFEDGLDRRQGVVERMIEQGWIAEPADDEEFVAVTQSVETFHAFLAAWVGAMHQAGLTSTAPRGFVEGEGWVFVPDVTRKAPYEGRVFE